MHSTRVGAIRPVARFGVIPAVLASLAVLASPSAGVAATSIGSVGGDITCSAGFSTVQISSSGPSYAVPAGGGNITAWSTQATGTIGPVALQVWRSTGTANTYQLVGASPLVTLTSASLNTFTLATPIAVQAGDLLGLRLEGRALCAQTTASNTDVFGGVAGANPAAGATALFSLNRFLDLNVEATVEAATTPPPPPTCDRASTTRGHGTCKHKKHHKDPKEHEDKKGPGDGPGGQSVDG